MLTGLPILIADATVFPAVIGSYSSNPER